MARVFSWKLNDKDNAYLYIPGKKNHISERITDSNVINTMIEKVGGMNETKYKAAFDSMNEEIKALYGEIIPYKDSFFSETGAINNVVILSSSKDVKSNEEIVREMISEIKEELMATINEHFNDLRTEMFNSYEVLKKTNNKQTFDMLELFEKKRKETINSVEDIKTDMNKRLSEAEKTLNKASKVLELDGNDINVDSIKKLVSESSKNSEWLRYNKDAVAEIKADYINAKKTFSSKGKNNLVFENLVNSMENLDSTIIKAKEIVNESEMKLNEIKVIKQEIELAKSNEMNNDVVMGSSRDVYEFKAQNGNSMLINEDGIHLNGTIFFNGNKQ